jgi:hypothetical protein
MLMVAVMGSDVVLIAVNEGILPVPPEARPIAVLLFVQVKVAPDGVPLTEVRGTVALAQYAWLPIAETEGVELILTVTF